MEKSEEVIKEHFYHSDKRYKRKQEELLKTLNEDKHNKDFIDNHLGRNNLRDNEYDKEEYYNDERFEQ